MVSAPFIIEVNQDNFDQVVIEGSKNALVLVDFWADWCNPCKMLMPVLEKLAEEYNGQFVLAKVNSDQNQELATKYGVRSLPTVKLFKDGEAADEFMGALPESQVREFLDKHIERESDILHDQAIAAREAGDIQTAQSLLQQANSIDPGRSGVMMDLAMLLADNGEIEKAETLLQGLPQQEKDRQPASGLMARLGFVNEAAQIPKVDGLRAALDEDATDLNSRLKLAVRLIAEGDYAEGLDELLEIMRKERNYDDDIARKTILKVFDLLGEASLVNEYRRKMASVLN